MAAFFEFLNKAQEIRKKHYVVNLALYDSFSRNIWAPGWIFLNLPRSRYFYYQNLLKFKTHRAILGVGAGVWSSSSSYIAVPSVIHFNLQRILGAVLAVSLPPLISGGVTFTRWGRSVCGMGEQVVYKGVVAGPSGVTSSSKSTGK